MNESNSHVETETSALSLEDVSNSLSHAITSALDGDSSTTRQIFQSPRQKKCFEQQSSENLKLYRQTILKEAVRQVTLHQNYKNILKICLDHTEAREKSRIGEIDIETRTDGNYPTDDSSSSLCLDGLSELEMLCLDNEMMRMSLIYSGILPELMSLLTSQDGLIQETMTHIFYLLSSSEEGARALLDQSQLISLLPLLLIDVISIERRTTTEFAKEFSMCTFMSLCQFDSNHAIQLDEKTFSKLITAIQQRSGSSSIDPLLNLKTRECLAGAIVSLSRRESYQLFLFSSNFISFSISVLEDQQDRTYQFMIHLLEILFNLSLLDERKVSIGEFGLIPILLTILKHEKQDQPSNFYLDTQIVLELAAGILLSLSTKIPNKRLILEDVTMIKLLLDYLEITYPLPIRTNVIGILVNLSMNDKVQNYIVTHSGLLIYINSLKTFSSYHTNALLSTPVTSALSSFSSSFHHSINSRPKQAKHTSSSSSSAALSPLSSHPNYQLLLQYLFRILAAFVWLLSLRYHRDIMIHLGLVPKLCSLLHSPFREEIKLLVTGLMLALAEDKENLYSFTANDSHGVITLFTLFKDTKPVSDGILILENITGCLLNIVSADSSMRHYLVAQGIIPFLVRLLPIIPSDNLLHGNNQSSSDVPCDLKQQLHEQLQVSLPVSSFIFDKRGGGYMSLAENSTELLRLLILSDEIRAEIISLGVLPLLLRLLEHGSLLARESSIGILLCLVYQEEFIPPVLQLPFIATLVGIAENSKGMARVKDLIIETFYYISRDEDLRGALGRAGVITPLVMVLKYGSNLQIKHLSLETLLLLAEEDDNKPLIGERNGLISLLISYMRGTVEQQSQPQQQLDLSSTQKIEDDHLNSQEHRNNDRELLLEMKDMSTALLRSLAEDLDCRNLMRKAHLTPQSILYHGTW